MSAEQALFDAYREWYRLAKAGQRAICRRDWKFLLECQDLVKKIQPSISNLTRDARGEWKRQTGNGTGKEQQLRATILDLTALLDANQKLLRAARVTALAEREKLAQAGQNLKRLQNTYAKSGPSVWASLS